MTSADPVPSGGTRSETAAARAKFVYEGAPLQAIAVDAQIVPEPWGERDEALTVLNAITPLIDAVRDLTVRLAAAEAERDALKARVLDVAAKNAWLRDAFKELGVNPDKRTWGKT